MRPSTLVLVRKKLISAQCRTTINHFELTIPLLLTSLQDFLQPQPVLKGGLKGEKKCIKITSLFSLKRNKYLAKVVKEKSLITLFFHSTPRGPKLAGCHILLFRFINDKTKKKKINLKRSMVNNKKVDSFFFKVIKIF